MWMIFFFVLYDYFVFKLKSTPIQNDTFVISFSNYMNKNGTILQNDH